MKGSAGTVEQILRLDAETDAVPTARRFVASQLRGSSAEGRTADAELVITELATNALMYGAPPVTLRVEVKDDLVRIEVADGSHEAPLRGRGGPDAMTGRGLILVEGVSTRWGVIPHEAGKIVWAEVAGGGTASTGTESGPELDVDIDGLLAGWPDLAEGRAAEATFTITLGDVPTDLLLAAKAHVDNLVREFTLAVTGAAAGQTAAVSPDLARLIETVTTRFAQARQAIKRQAVAAAAAGEERTRLRLTLPLSAAAAGCDFLAALDQADAYARAARLLTLETPPQHRAFRHWYVTSLVNQLGRLARGEQPPPAPSFEQYLLDELGIVTAAHRATDRSARLQDVTSALAGASTPEEVAEIVVSQGVAALGASGGALLVPVDEELLAVPGAVGYGEELVEQLRAERRDARLPAAHALRTGESLWLESRDARDRQFPAITGLEPATVSMCAVPLTTGNARLGALRFSFESPRLFDEDERRFVLALAAQTSQALERSQLYGRERRARSAAETAAARLARLHHVTASLAGASEVREIADIVAAEAGETLGASMSALCLLEDDTTLRVFGMHGAQPGTADRWTTFALDADLPASEAVRTNRPLVVASRAELEGRFPLLAGQLPVEGSLACVPLAVGGRRLGALSLTFPPEHVIDDEEVELLTTIGRQCAVAVERARLFEAERAARERAAFIDEATVLLTSSLEPAETLAHLVGLFVPALADWALVYLVDRSGRVGAVTAAHRDPAMTEVMLQLQREQPLDRAASGGLGEVLRTGHSIRYEVVPDEVRARVTRGFEGSDAADSIAPRSGLGIPLIVRGAVLGAMALARTHGAPYTEDDRALAEEIAARAAVAVDNAEQFRRERDAALTLQRSLLPQQLPHLPGVAFAWRYLPGAAGTHIGGDWYDVIPLDKDRVALVIGDVMGRGLRAAAVMGQLRATARAHASADLGPAEVLAQLDAALGRLEQEQITTALFGLLEPATGSLTVASAGHLPPLVTDGHGVAYYLDVEPGPPLGAGGQAYPELTVVLPPAATLLLFTDGLVEDRQMPVDTGLEALRHAVARAAGPEDICDRALVALGRDTEHDDDTAMLAVGLLRASE
ncbi:MAG: SpoIIE family protein phosphatase [Actinomycetes bacterium]